MAIAMLKPSFAAGEISPSLFGRLDVPKVGSGCSVLRNAFVSYRGGAASRAGLELVCQTKQPASANSIPPRIIRFQFSITQSYILEFGDGYMRVIANGGVVTDDPMPISAITQAFPATVTVPGNDFAADDWIFLSGIPSMPIINGRTCIVTGKNGDNLTISDTFGVPIDTRLSSAFADAATATAARIFETAAPYDAEDLPFLKVVQSADVMSLCCVNPDTGKEYDPVDLKRLASNDWVFEPLTFASRIAAPASCSGTASVAGTTNYAYCVTAVDKDTGDESIASPIAFIKNSANIGATAGSHTITWDPVDNASEYYVYQAPPAYNAAVPYGSSFGFLGRAFGNQFVNNNITSDMSKTPPVHLNPFARGEIIAVKMTNGGTGYTQTTAALDVTTVDGSGFVGYPIVVSGAIVAVFIQNNGEGYKEGDTIAFTDSGAGAGATGVLQIGPQKGTSPAVVNYFQSRRVYGSTLNNPDTLFFSQNTSYKNFDSAVPPIDSDAITVTPWGTQVNGVQWLQPAPGGLLVATGLDAWQMSGAGGAGSPITPASESATAQESNGFSRVIKPIKIGSDILYVGSLNSQVYDMEYNFWNNIYSGADISVMSTHLFENYGLKYWAFAKQPSKIVWVTRSDGKFLSLTFLKKEELSAWGRHDTNGLVVGNEVATETTLDAAYFVVKRYIRGVGKWVYFIERMDNRTWIGSEDPFCVDCGLRLYQPMPSATLSPSAAQGTGAIAGGYVLAGGTGYTAPSAKLIDPTGQGTGGSVTVTAAGGVITGFAYTAGQNYSPSTYVEIDDPTGSGAAVQVLVSYDVVFEADQPVFGAAAAGDVLRVGGGIASIKSITSPIEVIATIIAPIIKTVPNDPYNLPIPAAPGEWTLTRPISTVTNLWHLEGMDVAVLADGEVMAGGDRPLLTVKNGSITLDRAASNIKVGLPYTVQVQAMHAENSNETVQTKEKRITQGGIRVEASRGIKVGANQPVASTLQYQQEIPWKDMQDVPDMAIVDVPLAAVPLFTGDHVVPIKDDFTNWNGYEPAPGMMCAQQTNPLPMNILAMVPHFQGAEENSP